MYAKVGGRKGWSWGPLDLKNADPWHGHGCLDYGGYVGATVG